MVRKKKISPNDETEDGAEIISTVSISLVTQWAMAVRYAPMSGENALLAYIVGLSETGDRLVEITLNPNSIQAFELLHQGILVRPNGNKLSPKKKETALADSELSLVSLPVLGSGGETLQMPRFLTAKDGGIRYLFVPKKGAFKKNEEEEVKTEDETTSEGTPATLSIPGREKSSQEEDLPSEAVSAPETPEVAKDQWSKFHLFPAAVIRFSKGSFVLAPNSGPSYRDMVPTLFEKLAPLGVTIALFPPGKGLIVQEKLQEEMGQFLGMQEKGTGLSSRYYITEKLPDTHALYVLAYERKVLMRDRIGQGNRVDKRACAQSFRKGMIFLSNDVQKEVMGIRVEENELFAQMQAEENSSENKFGTALAKTTVFKSLKDFCPQWNLGVSFWINLIATLVNFERFGRGKAALQRMLFCLALTTDDQGRLVKKQSGRQTGVAQRMIIWFLEKTWTIKMSNGRRLMELMRRSRTFIEVGLIAAFHPEQSVREAAKSVFEKAFPGKLADFEAKLEETLVKPHSRLRGSLAMHSFIKRMQAAGLMTTKVDTAPSQSTERGEDSNSGDKKEEPGHIKRRKYFLSWFFGDAEGCKRRFTNSGMPYQAMKQALATQKGLLIDDPTLRAETHELLKQACKHREDLFRLLESKTGEATPETEMLFKVAPGFFDLLTRFQSGIHSAEMLFEAQQKEQETGGQITAGAYLLSLFQKGQREEAHLQGRLRQALVCHMSETMGTQDEQREVFSQLLKIQEQEEERAHENESAKTQEKTEEQARKDDLVKSKKKTKIGSFDALLLEANGFLEEHLGKPKLAHAMKCSLWRARIQVVSNFLTLVLKHYGRWEEAKDDLTETAAA
ncbi:MAG: hypothetical protein FJY91_00960 [Candidatus Harrisonbacteria bacterium]|nr:hypothetical protein [Candidatus Harrisonbacteria bacterium]